MYYIDTHAHLVREFEKQNFDQLQKEFQKFKLNKILNIGTSIQNSKEVIALSKKYPNWHPVVGIHPCDCQNLNDINEIEKLLQDNSNIVAVGEIGLDYFHINKSNFPIKEHQKKAFELQLELAIKFNLPVVIHCRDAIDEVYAILSQKKFTKLKGVMHTFSGNYEQAKRFIKLGYYISFSGVVTFKNAIQTQEVARKIELDKILSETDSPFLTPVPFRGKPNSPKNVIYVVKKIAELRKKSEFDICSAIINNVKKLFNI